MAISNFIYKPMLLFSDPFSEHVGCIAITKFIDRCLPFLLVTILFISCSDDGPIDTSMEDTQETDTTDTTTESASKYEDRPWCRITG